MWDSFEIQTVNNVTENFDFNFICSLDFKNSWGALFLLHMKTMNSVVSWYILALHHLFHFIACVLFVSMFLFFSQFFCEFYYSVRYWGKFGDT